jgi:hypothetical protein
LRALATPDEKITLDARMLEPSGKRGDTVEPGEGELTKERGGRAAFGVRLRAPGGFPGVRLAFSQIQS